MKRFLLATALVASVPGGLALAEGDEGDGGTTTTDTGTTDTTTVRSVSSATSAAIAFDTRFQTTVESEPLPEFGTDPLGVLFILR